MSVKKTIIEWEYFFPKEVKCKCGKCNSIGNEMKPELMEPLIVLRRTLGFPLRVTSAYRCPEHNRNVGTTGLTGAHTTGLAIDIGVYMAEAYALLTEACRMQCFSGLGISQSGDLTKRFIHLDALDPEKYRRPALWSY